MKEGLLKASSLHWFALIRIFASWVRIISFHFIFTAGNTAFPLAALKAAMNLKGQLNVGPPRLPVTPLKQNEVDKLQRDLQNIGFFEWS